MKISRYSIRYNKYSKLYSVFLSGFFPMYCGSFDTKEEAKDHIKRQKAIL